VVDYTLPHTASSAPWSSTPSLHRSISLAVNAAGCVSILNTKRGARHCRRMLMRGDIFVLHSASRSRLSKVRSLLSCRRAAHLPSKSHPYIDCFSQPFAGVVLSGPHDPASSSTGLHTSTQLSSTRRNQASGKPPGVDPRAELSRQRRLREPHLHASGCASLVVARQRQASQYVPRGAFKAPKQLPEAKPLGCALHVATSPSGACSANPTSEAGRAWPIYTYTRSCTPKQQSNCLTGPHTSYDAMKKLRIVTLVWHGATENGP
jgi:hypothetical protein